MSDDRPKAHDRFLNSILLRFIPKFVRPNHLTVSRFLLTPLVMWLTIRQDYVTVIPLFLVVAFTDVLDGSLARIRHQVTRWGKIYDPVADKLLIGSLVGILVTQYLGWYLGIAIIVIELLFLVLGWYEVSKGRVVQANGWGKIKMNFQVLGVVLLLLGLATGFNGFFGVSATTFYIAIFFALISLFTSGV